MWKPPERIKYQTTVAQLAYRAGGRRRAAFTRRIILPLICPSSNARGYPAMVPWRASEEGDDVTQDVIDWYARFAEGRPGALSSLRQPASRDIPSGPLLRISDDRYVAGLRRLTDAVRRRRAAVRTRCAHPAHRFSHHPAPAGSQRPFLMRFPRR